MITPQILAELRACADACEPIEARVAGQLLDEIERLQRELAGARQSERLARGLLHDLEGCVGYCDSTQQWFLAQRVYDVLGPARAYLQPNPAVNALRWSNLDRCSVCDEQYCDTLDSDREPAHAACIAAPATPRGGR